MLLSISSKITSRVVLNGTKQTVEEKIIREPSWIQEKSLLHRPDQYTADSSETVNGISIIPLHCRSRKSIIKKRSALDRDKRSRDPKVSLASYKKDVLGFQISR